MSKWEMMRLGDVLITQPKSKIKAGDGNISGTYKFFTSSNFQNKRINTADYMKPSLIFGTGGNPSVHFCNEPFSTSTDCIVFSGIESQLKSIFLYLKSNIFLLGEGFKGAGLKHISKDYILNIQVPLPPIQMQSKIIDIFDCSSTLIEKRKNQIKYLDLLVKSRFIEMFGDPVTNSKGWGMKRLDEISTTRLGKMLDAKRQTGKSTYPYLANFNVQWFRFNFETLNKMDFNALDRIEFSLKYGDLLICEGGEVGRTAIWKNELSDCFFQKALHRVRCNSNICIPEYIAWVMFFKTITHFDGIITGVTIAHLTGEKLKTLKIQIPPLALQNQFADFVQLVDKYKFVMQAELEKLELCYKALMQKYFG